MGKESRRRSWRQSWRDPLGTRLGRKLLGLFLLFSLVPLLGSNMIGYLESRGIIEGLIQRQMSALAEVEAQHVRDQVDRLLLGLDMITSTSGFSEAADDALSADVTDMIAPAAQGPIHDRLQRMLEELWQFEAIFLQHPAGKIVASAGALEGLDEESAAPPGETARLEVLDARTRAGLPRFRLRVPVRGAGGRTIGYLGALMELRGLGGLLQIPEHLAGWIESFVLDASGRPLFISHPHGYVDWAAPLATPLREMEPRAFVRYTDRVGVEVFGTAVPIPEHDWQYVAEFPVSAALGPLRFLRRISIILGSGFAVLLVVTAWLVAGGVVAPVRHLVGAVRRVGHGDLDARVETTASDEIGELGRAFNEMAGDLASAQARVEDLHKREIERAQQLATTGELASGVAHEIKNPVVGIAGGLDLVRRRIGDDEKLTPIIDEMSHQLSRIELAVKDLLAFARPAAPTLAAADGNLIVERAIRLVEPAAEKRGVTISYEPDSTLPELWVDAELVGQALVNLMVNAVQATPAGGRVTVSTRREGEEVRFRVRDTGKGIDPAALEEIFKPFFTTRHSGTGLGLSISREIVERHGGRIEAESRVGEGATFTLSVPVDGVARPAASEPAASEHLAGKAPQEPPGAAIGGGG